MKSDNPLADPDGSSNQCRQKLVPGTWLGDCEVLGFLGEGGMGEVYKVRHKYLNKILALKVLTFSAGQAAERFKNEARTLASLSHENIVSIYDFFTDEKLSLPCLTMEYIQGESMADAVSRLGPMQEDRVTGIFAQIFAALSYAHERRIIHRDIKPSNIYLSLDSGGKERVHLLDFGIAKIISQANNSEHDITRTGEIVGSPIYMSPEQCLGEKVSELSDLYSTGCCLFYCLTGRPPLKGANALATIAAKVEGKTESLAALKDQLQVSNHLIELTDRLLQRHPSHRPASAAEASRLLRKESSPKDEPHLPVAGSGNGKTRKIRTPLLLMAILIPVLAMAIFIPRWTHQRSMEKELSNKPLKVRIDPRSGSCCLEFSSDSGSKRELGTISYFSRAEGKPVAQELKGAFSIPASAQVDLTFWQGIEEKTEIIDAFPANLVSSVSIASGVKKPEAIILKLKRFSNLRTLALTGQNVDDKCLGAIETLPQLSTLQLNKTLVNPESLGRCNLLKRLTGLKITGEYQVGRIFQASGSCPQLRQLATYDTEFQKNDLSSLKNLPNLTSLILEFENLEALPLSLLSNNRHLQSLNFTGSAVSENTLAELAKLTNLKNLVSRDSIMTEAQLKALVKALVKALPQTSVEIKIIDLSKPVGNRVYAEDLPR